MPALMWKVGPHPHGPEPLSSPGAACVLTREEEGDSRDMTPRPARPGIMELHFSPARSEATEPGLTLPSGCLGLV